MYIKNFETDNKHRDNNNQWFEKNDVNIENNSASNNGAATELFNRSQMVRRAPPPLPAAPTAPRMIMALGQNPRQAPPLVPLQPAFPTLPPLPTLPPIPTLTFPSLPTLPSPVFPTPNLFSIFDQDFSHDFNFNLEIKPNNQKTTSGINQTLKNSDLRPSKQTTSSSPATRTAASTASNNSKPNTDNTLKSTANTSSSKNQEKQKDKSKNDESSNAQNVSGSYDSQSSSYTSYDASSNEGYSPYNPMEDFQKVDNQFNSNINDSDGGLILLSKNGDGRNAFMTSVVVIIVVFGFLMLSVGIYIHKSKIRAREIDARRQEEEILNTYKNVINNDNTIILQNKHLKNVIETLNPSPPPQPRNNHRIRPNMYIKSPLGDPDNVITCPSSTTLSEKTSASETASYSSTTADIGGHLDLYTKLLLK